MELLSNSTPKFTWSLVKLVPQASDMLVYNISNHYLVSHDSHIRLLGWTFTISLSARPIIDTWICKEIYEAICIVYSYVSFLLLQSWLQIFFLQFSSMIEKKIPFSFPCSEICIRQPTMSIMFRGCETMINPRGIHFSTNTWKKSFQQSVD